MTNNKNKSIFIVKGLRPTSAHPTLKTDIVQANFDRGYDTTLILDLHILSDMTKVIEGERTLSSTRLDIVIGILNRTNNLHLAPGMGLAEVSDQFL